MGNINVISKRKAKRIHLLLLIFIVMLHFLVQFNSMAQEKTALSVGPKPLAQQATEINPDLLSKPWLAKWISYPDNSNTDFGVYLFRKDFTADTKPGKFIVHVSADNRYKLYINGVYVCNGPARSYLYKWNFESIDISPYLHPGKNIISSIVWNFSWQRPLAQMSGHTGFIMQGNTTNENTINTDTSWVVFKNAAYKPVPVNLNQYYAAGAGEEFDCEKHPWNWMDNDLNAVGWKQAQVIETGKPLGCACQWGEASVHLLSPREIPMMEEKEQRFFKVRRSDIANISNEFLLGKTPVTIPANSKVKLLIDQKELTTAYPVLHFSKGAKSNIKLTYAESLFDSIGNKGNRNDIENKKIYGYSDVIICDGENNRIFQTLWWRTFRYIEIEIETKKESLVLSDFYSIFSAYPLEEKASFNSDNPGLKDVWNVGWRTQRLCANETFFDCPYYEQLQYIGDARIQSLVSTYVSGDSRLTKNAIAVLHESQLPAGITQSRFPSSQVQIIPPFSLVWVTMVYDYWMLNDDEAFVKSMIPGMQETLNWFRNRIDSSGMLGPVEWWDFVDWVNADGWKDGEPPSAHNGNSSVLSLQYVYTLHKAAAIFDAYNMHDLALEYKNVAAKIKKAVFEKCYDPGKGLFADSPEKRTFSQHANVLAILTNAFTATTDKAKVINTILNNKDLAQCTLYFNYYLFEALDKAGQANQFIAALTPWEKMLQTGLSTFAETLDPTRSDCHAWSASPVYYFLSLVAGIQPASPGFKSVRIQPNFGTLKNIDATMPHKLGTIHVKLKKENKNGVNGEITLPAHVGGVFIWNGVEKKLKEGINSINIAN